jgi:hypothetical protein
MHPPNIYMVELSPVSTQGLRVLPLSYFAGKQVIDPSQAQINSRLADLGTGVLQDELRVIPMY